MPKRFSPEYIRKKFQTKREENFRKKYNQLRKVKEDVQSPNVKTGKWKGFVFKVAKWGMHLDKVADLSFKIPFVPRVVSYGILGVDKIFDIIHAKMSKDMK